MATWILPVMGGDKKYGYRVCGMWDVDCGLWARGRGADGWDGKDGQSESMGRTPTPYPQMFVISRGQAEKREGKGGPNEGRVPITCSAHLLASSSFRSESLHLFGWRKYM